MGWYMQSDDLPPLVADVASLIGVLVSFLRITNQAAVFVLM